MIKLDIVNRVADRTGVPKMKAEQAVDALFNSMKEALTRGERIELRGFGVFVVKPRKRGVGRNPRTGEEVAIPSGKTIRFKPGKELQAHGFEGDIHTLLPLLSIQTVKQQRQLNVFVCCENRYEVIELEDVSDVMCTPVGQLRPG